MTRTDKEELINHFTWLINNAGSRIAGGFSDYEKCLNKHILYVLNNLEEDDDD